MDGRGRTTLVGSIGKYRVLWFVRIQVRSTIKSRGTDGSLSWRKQRDLQVRAVSQCIASRTKQKQHQAPHHHFTTQSRPSQPSSPRRWLPPPRGRRARSHSTVRDMQAAGRMQECAVLMPPEATRNHQGEYFRTSLRHDTTRYHDAVSLVPLTQRNTHMQRYSWTQQAQRAMVWCLTFRTGTCTLDGLGGYP